MCIRVHALLRKTVWQLLKNLKTITKSLSNSTSGYIPKRTQSRTSNISHIPMLSSSIIYNSQRVEATQVSRDRRKDEQNVLYNGLFSLKKGTKF